MPKEKSFGFLGLFLVRFFSYSSVAWSENGAVLVLDYWNLNEMTRLSEVSQVAHMNWNCLLFSLWVWMEMAVLSGLVLLAKVYSFNYEPDWSATAWRQTCAEPESLSRSELATENFYGWKMSGVRSSI